MYVSDFSLGNALFLFFFYILKFISLCSYFYIAKNSYKYKIRKCKKELFLARVTLLFLLVGQSHVTDYCTDVSCPTMSTAPCPSPCVNNWQADFYLFAFLFRFHCDFLSWHHQVESCMRFLICSLEKTALCSVSNLFSFAFSTCFQGS